MIDQRIQRSSIAELEPLIISELKVHSSVYGQLYAISVTERKASNGKMYLELKLRDQRGCEITARYFDPPASEKLTLHEGKVVILRGVIDTFKNQVCLKLSHAETDEATSPDLFMPGTRRPKAELEDDFTALMNKVDHPGLWQLLNCCFSPEVMGRFCCWPAAVRHHGAVVGGLLEHTVNVATIAAQLACMYPCNHNLVITGALLHDIGKLTELEEQIGAGFTVDGRMFGHIFRGVHYVQEHAKAITELDEATLNDVLHIILAHHTKEYGSPVSPVTCEALIVHLADMAEANLTEFIEHCQRTSGSDGWSAYSTKFGGNLRVP